jgi:hypothetical protein
LEHLTTSHSKLRAAQAKFRDCVRSINDGVTGSEKKGTDGRDDILVPLTSSLYVKGRLTDREKVLVDVGTGFYVEKVCDMVYVGGWFSNWAHILFFRPQPRRLHSTMIRLRDWSRTCRIWRRLYRLRAHSCGLLKRVSLYHDLLIGSARARRSCLLTLTTALRQKMLAGEAAPQAAAAG